MDDAAESTKAEMIEWRDFLTDYPPGIRKSVDRAASIEVQYVGRVQVKLPELQLHCSGSCQRTTYCTGATQASGKLFGELDEAQAIAFDATHTPDRNKPFDAIIVYTCDKCHRKVKSYSIRFWSLANTFKTAVPVDVQKIAEWPPFKPPIPEGVDKLIKPDRDLFLKGRQAEMHFQGIGAFAYYRRVVEQQKNRLLEAALEVARREGMDQSTLTKLEVAIKEHQFDKAIDSVKDAIPRSLYIKTHNPFTLLFKTLSKGIHEQSDEECLDKATSIRLILVQFAKRPADAMDDDTEINEALNRLTQ